MSVVLLAGPPAVGHNTIAEAVCEKRERCALVDVDDVRALVKSGNAMPWEEPDGTTQYLLGIRNACALARGFDAEGFDVLLVDVAPPETLDLYKAELASVNRLFTVLLYADADVLVSRDIERDSNPNLDVAAIAFWHDRIRSLRELLVTNIDKFETSIDTGKFSVEESVTKLTSLIDS